MRGPGEVRGAGPPTAAHASPFPPSGSVLCRPVAPRCPPPRGADPACSPLPSRRTSAPRARPAGADGGVAPGRRALRSFTSSVPSSVSPLPPAPGVNLPPPKPGPPLGRTEPAQQGGPGALQHGGCLAPRSLGCGAPHGAQGGIFRPRTSLGQAGSVAAPCVPTAPAATSRDGYGPAAPEGLHAAGRRHPVRSCSGRGWCCPVLGGQGGAGGTLGGERHQGKMLGLRWEQLGRVNAAAAAPEGDLPCLAPLHRSPHATPASSINSFK